MPAEFTLSQTDIDATTNHELFHGTVRCLPKPEDIPDEFWLGNVYTQIVEALYVGEPPAASKMTFNQGFEQTIKVVEFITAHVRSFEPDYEHKIAGVGFMMSKIITVTKGQ